MWRGRGKDARGRSRHDSQFDSRSLAAVFAVGCPPATPNPRPETCVATKVPPADTTIYDTTQVQFRPVLIGGPPLTYPDRARRENVQARVELAVVINPDGRAEPRSIRLVSPVLYREFVDAAAEYVRLASFTPACRDGQPVRVRVKLPFDFKITTRIMRR